MSAGAACSSSRPLAGAGDAGTLGSTGTGVMGKKSGAKTAVRVSNPLLDADGSEDEEGGEGAREALDNTGLEGDVATLMETTSTGTLTNALELTAADKSEHTAVDQLPELSAGSAHARAQNRKRLENFRTDSVLGTSSDLEGALLSGDMALRGESWSPTTSKQLRDTTLSTVQLEQQRYDKMLAAEDWMRENWIINPVGTFRKRWDIAQMLLLAYLTVSVPYRIGFSHDAHPWKFWFVFDLLVDVYFLVDIVLSFRTAFYNFHGDLEYYPGQIIKNYIKSWFLVDITGSIPINYVVLVMELDSTTAGYKGNRFLRMMRLFRLLKLLRLLRVNRLLKKYEEAFYGIKSSMKMAKIAASVLVVGHWLACVWWYFGTPESIDFEYDPATGDPLYPWTEHVFGPDVHNSTRVLQSTKYVTALYWSFMTMTTVGYGDVHARTMVEKIVSIVSMLIGGFVFGLVIGSLSDVSRRANPAGKEAKKRVGWISAYVRRTRNLVPLHILFRDAVSCKV